MCYVYIYHDYNLLQHNYHLYYYFLIITAPYL